MTTTPDPIPWRPARKAIDHTAQGRPTGADVENALEAAERMLASALQDRRHYDNLRLISVSVLSLVLTAIGSFVAAATVHFSAGHFQALVIPLAVLVSSGGVLLAALSRTMIRYRYRARTSYHGRLAADLAGLVEQSFVSVAEREGWDAFRITAIRIRLSAFPLTPQPDHDSDVPRI